MIYDKLTVKSYMISTEVGYLILERLECSPRISPIPAAGTIPQRGVILHRAACVLPEISPENYRFISCVRSNTLVASTPSLSDRRPGLSWNAEKKYI